MCQHHYGIGHSSLRGLELALLPSGLGFRHLPQSGAWKSEFQT